MNEIEKEIYEEFKKYIEENFEGGEFTKETYQEMFRGFRESDKGKELMEKDISTFIKFLGKEETLNKITEEFSGTEIAAEEEQSQNKETLEEVREGMEKLLDDPELKKRLTAEQIADMRRRMEQSFEDGTIENAADDFQKEIANVFADVVKDGYDLQDQMRDSLQNGALRDSLENTEKLLDEEYRRSEASDDFNRFSDISAKSDGIAAVQSAIKVLNEEGNRAISQEEFDDLMELAKKEGVSLVSHNISGKTYDAITIEDADKSNTLPVKFENDSIGPKK